MPPATLRNAIGRILLITALVASGAAYYAVHPPLGAALVAALATSAGHVLAAGWLLVAAGALGRAGLRAGQGGVFVLSEGERVVVEVALGVGVLGLGTLAMGMAGKLVFAWAFAVVPLVLWRAAWAWGQSVVRAARAVRASGRLGAVAAGYVGVMLALALLRALAPPVRWDALSYHLTLPQRYLDAGSVASADDFYFSGLPQLAEMAFTLVGLWRGGPQALAAAQVLDVLWGALIVLGLAGYAGRVFGGAAGGLAAALWLSAPTIAAAPGWAYAEVLLTLYAVAIVSALEAWRLSGKVAWAALAGVLAGCALGTKYTGFVMGLGSALVLLGVAFDAWRSGGAARWRQAGSAGLAFGACAALTFAPWLIKNVVLTGNPLYPLLPRVLGGAYMDPLRDQFVSQPAHAEPLWRAPLIFFSAGFVGAQGANDYDINMGPLYIFLPLALALGWRRLDAQTRAQLRAPARWTLGVYLGWIAMATLSRLGLQGRFFFPAFPTLAVLALGGLRALPTFDAPRLRVSTLARGGVALALGLAALEGLVPFVAHGPLPYLVGAQNAQAYREEQLGWYAPMLVQVNALGPQTRVLFLWEPRAFDCAPSTRCLPDVVLDRWWHLRRTGAPRAEDALAQWRAAGVTHVLIYERGAAFTRTEDPYGVLTAEDWAELERLRGLLIEVARLGEGTTGYTLYALP